jgi:glycosyltransferase involved in cell wall biosynthesis
MRVTIVSRIFSPEPAAASFRLVALANALSDAGHDVLVLTTSTPIPGAAEVRDGVRVRRAPVLRDKAGYVRGYLQYLSFDVPAFFRLLGSRRADVVVVEPPPTTGFASRVACALRRTPYVYYAADIWSDAAASTGAPALVLSVVRRMEVLALRGAARILSVSDGVSNRLRQLGVERGVHLIGNGIDVGTFSPDGEVHREDRPYFLYAGTASEWHGAGIFVRAFERVLTDRADVQLVFLGQGAELDSMRDATAAYAGSVRFEPRQSPDATAAWLRGAVASLASVKPGQGYDFSFPTKMYASVACGTPVIYAGIGPGRLFAASNDLGEGVDYDEDAVVAAMTRALASPPAASRRRRIAAWASANVALSSVAGRAVSVLEGIRR